MIINWYEQLPGLIAGYDMADIFNCDETAFFFKQQPPSHLSFKAIMIMVISGTNPGFRCSYALNGLEKTKNPDDWSE